MNEIPDYFGELTAWRKFSIRDHGRLLVSANHPIPWPTADPGEACCVAAGNPAHPQNEPCPALTCTCGFYAYKSRMDAEQHAQGTMLAKVLVWGRIASHTRGYRAARIRIAELFVAPGYPEIAALHSRYQIPVTIDQGATSWISDSQNASSPSNPLASLFQNPQLTAQQLQQFHYQQMLNNQILQQPYQSGALSQAMHYGQAFASQIANDPILAARAAASKQLAEAEKWPLFNELKSDITHLMASNQKISLRQAYDIAIKDFASSMKTAPCPGPDITKGALGSLAHAFGLKP